MIQLVSKQSQNYQYFENNCQYKFRLLFSMIFCLCACHFFVLFNDKAEYTGKVILFMSKVRPSSGNRSISKNKPELKESRQRPGSAKPHSQLSSGFQSQNRVQTNYHTGKVLGFTDAKMIPTIHAYNPRSLKKCLVTDPKSYKKFYDQQGSCDLTRLYTTSFLAHFREWRKGLRNRIVQMLENVMGSETVDEKMISQVLQELKIVVQEIKESIESILSSKYSSSSAGQLKKQEASFENLKEYIEALLVIVHHLSQFVQEINAIMAEGPDCNVPEAQRRIRKLAKKYDTKVMDSLVFCSCHPQSNLVNKAEYKLKKKFDQVQKWALHSLEIREQMRVIRDKFMLNIKRIMETEGEADYYTVPVLQEIAEILNANDEFRLNNGHIFLGPPSKALETILQLNKEIDQHEIQFQIKFKIKSYLIIKNQHDAIKGHSVLKSLSDRGQQFKTSRKKLLLLSKIYNRNQDREYYQQLSTCIANTSDRFGRLDQLAQDICNKAKDKKYQRRNQYVVVLTDLLDLIQSYEEQQEKICNAILEILVSSDYLAEDLKAGSKLPDMSQSQKIDKLITVLNCSQFQANKVLTPPKYEPSPHQIKDDKIKEAIELNNQHLDEMANNIFPRMVQFSAQLKVLSRDQLVKQLLLFEDDIDTEPVHCFNLLKGFYGTMYKGVSSGKTHKITKEAVLKMTEYFHEQMKAAEQYRNCGIVQKYIEWMFENRVAIYLLESMGSLNTIIDDPINTLFDKQGQNLAHKHSYQGRGKIRKYLGIQQDVFEVIVQSSAKYIREKSLFDVYFVQCLNKINDFLQKQAIFMDFKSSIFKGTYYPSALILQEWVNWEFSYAIEESINQANIELIRLQQKQLLDKMIARLKGLIVESDKKYNLGREFVEACKTKISTISKYLLPLIEATQKTSFFSKPSVKEDKIENYRKVATLCLNFMRANQLFHIAICANNEDPITFLSEGSTKDISTILGLLEKKLGLPPNSIERTNGSNLFVPFEPMELAKELLEMQKGFNFLLQKPKQQNSSSNDFGFLLGSGGKNNKPSESSLQVEEQAIEEMQEDIEQMKLQEQMEEVIGEEQELQIDSRLEQNIEQEEIQKSRSNINFTQSHLKGSVSEITPQKPKRIYLRLKQLENLATIKLCLKFAREEFMLLKRELQIGKLALALNPSQPNQELATHLQQVLQRSSKNTISSLFNIPKKYSRAQMVVEDLRVSLKNKNKEERMHKFNSLINLLGFKYEVLYGEVFTNDFIVLFELQERGHYVHTILSRQNLLETPFVPHTDIQQVQVMFMDSIFGLRSEKNKNLDQIRKKIQGINTSLTEKYDSLKQKLYTYKKYPVDNGLETDTYIDTYIGKVTYGQQRFTQIDEISYGSYSGFLQQAKKLGQDSSHELCELICEYGEASALLFVRWDYQNLKNLIRESNFLISEYNNGNFIERKNAREVIFKYQDLQKHILETSLNVKGPNIKEIISLLTTKDLTPAKQLHYRNTITQISKALTEGSQGFEQVIKIGCVLGLDEQISKRVKSLKAQKDILCLVFQCFGEQATFLLGEGTSRDSQAEDFQKIQSQKFLMQAPKEKRQLSCQHLQKFHELFLEASFPHTVIKCRDRIIGIADHNISSQGAINSSLNCTQIENLSYKTQQHQFFTEITIQKLFVCFKLKNNLLNLANSSSIISLSQINQMLEQYILEIRCEDILRTVHELKTLMEEQVEIELEYPRKDVQFTLKKAEESGRKRKWEKVEKASLKKYQYGGQYSMPWLEHILQKGLEELIQKQKQKLAEEKRKQMEQQLRKIEEEQKKKKVEQQRVRYHHIVQHQAKIVLEDIVQKIAEADRRKKMSKIKERRVKSVGNLPAIPEDLLSLIDKVRKIYTQPKNKKENEDSEDGLSEVSFVLSEDLHAKGEQLEINISKVYKGSTLSPHFFSHLSREPKKQSNLAE